MKKLITFLLLSVIVLLSASTTARAQFSERGYPEHFAAGFIIGGAVSFYTFKKTDDKLKAWLFGAGAASAAGLLKEIADPLILDRTSNMTDFAYTALGGGAGASIIIPIRSRKEQKEKKKLQTHDFQ